MGLIHWWPLNKGLEDKINNTTLTNNGANFVDAKTGKGYQLNGISGTCLSQPYDQSIDPHCFSFSFWIKLSSTWSGWGQVFTIGKVGGSWTDIRIGFDINTNRIGYFTVSDGTDKLSYDGPNHTFETDVWYNVVCTFEEKKANLYVNGASATGLASATTTFLPKLSDATVMTFGGNTSEVGECIMCDIRIFDHRLSMKEIREIYKCKILDYKFNDPYVEGTTNLITKVQLPKNCTISNNVVSVDWKSNSADTYFRLPTPALTSGSTYTLSFDCDGIRNATVSFAVCNQSNIADHLLYLKDGRNEITFVANDTDVSNAANSNGIFFDDITRDAVSQFTLSNFQLEAKDHATPFTNYSTTRADGMVCDCSGFGNNGTNKGCVFAKGSDTSNTTDSLKFNGSTSYVEVPVFKSTFLQEDFTINFWVKEADSGRTIYFGDYNTTGKINFNIEKEGTNAGRLRIYYDNNPNKYFDETAIYPNQWTMITLAYDKDASLLSIYQNGAYKENFSVGTDLYKSSGHFRIGRDNRSDSTAFNGNMSEFTFYANCLTNDEIRQLYESKFEVAKSSSDFMESSGIYAKEFSEYVMEDGVDNNNLIYNGNLITKSNAGFSATTYDSTLGAIKVITQTPLNDDFIEISENATYKYSLDYYIQTAHTNTMYFVIFPYDIDKKFIDVTYTLHKGNTTLAADLVSGATSISLSSGANWATASSDSYMKYAGLCYSTAFGYNRCMKLLSITDTANNVATLKTAYSGVTIPSGTKIANFYGGGTYYYPGTLSVSAQTSNTGKWVHVEFTINGNSIRYGTRYIKIGMLSYTGTVYFRNMRFEHIVGNDEYKLQLLQRNVSNKESVFLTKRYRTSNLKTLLLEETGMNIRYIRDVLNGNSVNGACHWVEVQAFNGALQNVLYGRTWQEWTETSANLEKIHRITDGLTATGTYWEDNTNKKVTFDLGSVMNIKSIKIRHYYGDSRKYNNKTEVSADGTNWITVFDSAVSGTYTETSEGHEIFLNPIKTADYRCGKVHTHCFYEK